MFEDEEKAWCSGNCFWKFLLHLLILMMVMNISNGVVPHSYSLSCHANCVLFFPHQILNVHGSDVRTSKLLSHPLSMEGSNKFRK